MKKLGLFLHNRFEETEAVATIDILRRQGYTVDVISIENGLQVTGSHGIKIEADIKMDVMELDSYDGLIIPGGPGIEVAIDNVKLLETIETFSKTNKLLAAICAAPQILAKLGLLVGKNITHFPGADKFMSDTHEDLSKAAIIDGNIVTGQSAGTAVEFGLTIIEYFDGIEAKNKMREILVIK